MFVVKEIPNPDKHKKRNKKRRRPQKISKEFEFKNFEEVIEFLKNSFSKDQLTEFLKKYFIWTQKLHAQFQTNLTQQLLYQDLKVTVFIFTFVYFCVSLLK